MIILLLAGIACLAAAAFQLARPRRDAVLERRAALASVRSLTLTEPDAPATPRRSLVLAPVSALLVRAHLRLWRNTRSCSRLWNANMRSSSKRS